MTRCAVIDQARPRRFDGHTYDPAIDGDRLDTQLIRVQALMSDGEWRTLPEIVHCTGGTEASISARLRDLRKVRFGAFIVERRRVAGGLFEYRVTPRG